MTYRCNYKDGVVCFPGTETPDGEVVQWNKQTDIMVIKVPGYNYWASRGIQGYMYAEYDVIQVTGKTEKGSWTAIIGQSITSFPVRAKKENK